MDPAIRNNSGRRGPRWARALLITGRRALWRVSRRHSSLRLRTGSLPLQRVWLRLGRSPQRNQAWTVAAVTGIAGIVLLFLMYLNARDAAAAGRAIEADSQPFAAERHEHVVSESPGPAPSESLPEALVQTASADLAAPQPLVPLQVQAAEIEPLSLEVGLIRLPDDSPLTSLVEGHSPDLVINPSPLPEHQDEWSSARLDRKRLSPRRVLYADRISPAILQQLSAEIEAGDEARAAGRESGELNLAISKTAPESAAAGVPMDYEIVVRNDARHELTQALIEERLPAAHEVIDVSPPGLLEGQTLRWQIRDLAAGEERRIRVQILPTREGPAESVASVHSGVAVGATTLVRSLQLQLEITAPERVRVGEVCAINFRVTNAGTAPAEGVVLRNDLPAHLAHALGRELDLDVGALAPGDSREFHLSFLAAEPGAGENRSELVAGGEARQQAANPIEAVAPALHVRRWGPPQVNVGQPAVFVNRVINRGKQPLENAELIESVPEDFEVIEVAEAGEFDPQTRRVRWTVDEIAPGETVELPIALRPTRPGPLRTTLEARSADESTGPIAARTQAVSPRRVTSPPPGVLVPCCR